MINRRPTRPGTTKYEGTYADKSGLGGSDPARVHSEDRTKKIIRKGMSMAFDRRSGEIRDSMRDIIESQVQQLKEASKERILSNSEAATLHRISIVWKSVESANKEEADKQDFSDLSDDELLDAAQKAERFLKG